MTEETSSPSELSRRRLLAAGGVLGAGLAAGLAQAETVPTSFAGTEPGKPAAPPVAGLHLQFGQNASSGIAVSWHTLEAVDHPRVLLGTMDGRLLKSADAAPRILRVTCCVDRLSSSVSS